MQPQTKEVLYRNAVWIHKNTGTAQVGVVTVPTIGNATLEDFSVSRFRSLGLGSKERNDGVMLLYTAKENHVRIEIGYGLEGRITDGKAGAILDQYFLPHVKAGDIGKAFVQTQGALIQEVAAEYGVDTSEKTATGELPAPTDYEKTTTSLLSGVPGFVKILVAIGIVLLLFLDFKFTGGMVTYALLSIIRRGGSSGGGGFGGGRGGGGSSGGGGASR